jgi:hypothetical protein
VNDPNYPAPSQQPPYAPPPPPASGGSKLVPILAGLVIALIGANLYLFTQIDQLKGAHAALEEAFKSDLAKVRESSSVTQAAAARKLENLQDELESARRAAAMAVGQAKIDAERKVSETESRLAQQQRAVEQKMTTEIAKTTEEINTAKKGIEAVNTEVTGVKTEVDKTKSELQNTIASLKSVAGDLGVASGLIATNSKELAALKALGERNYFEFKLAKSKNPQRVGDVLLQLSKSDAKKNRYTLVVTADDKKTEKKDKGLNEPVQFYTSKARQPYEIVVNVVGKDVIEGYLATPKVASSR